MHGVATRDDNDDDYLATERRWNDDDDSVTRAIRRWLTAVVGNGGCQEVAG